MKKYLASLVVSTALVSINESVAASSQLSRAWSETASVTSKQPTKTSSGAKLDPATATVKAKDVDLSIMKALDMVEERVKFNNERIIRTLDNSIKTTANLKNYVNTSISALDKKIMASSEESRRASESAKKTNLVLDSFTKAIDKEIADAKSSLKNPIAMSFAMAALQYDSRPQHFSVAAGASYYEGQYAVSAGVGYTHPLGYRGSIQGVTDFKTFGVSASLGYTFGLSKSHGVMPKESAKAPSHASADSESTDLED